MHWHYIENKMEKICENGNFREIGLDLLSRGLRPRLLRPNTKIQLLNKSTDKTYFGGELTRSEWLEYCDGSPFRQCNVGVVLGYGVAVIDIDDPVWLPFFEDVESLRVRTRKGVHIYVRYPTEYGNERKIHTIFRGKKIQIDVLSDGYAVWAGSVVYDEKTGTTTKYELDDKSTDEILEIDCSPSDFVSRVLEEKVPRDFAFEAVGDGLEVRPRVKMQSDNRVDVINIFKKWIPTLRTTATKIECPFHQENNPSLSIYGTGFKCFGCAQKGSLRKLVRKLSEMHDFDIGGLLIDLVEAGLVSGIKGGDAEFNDIFTRLMDRHFEEYPIYKISKNSFVQFNGRYYEEDVERDDVLNALRKRYRKLMRVPVGDIHYASLRAFREYEFDTEVPEAAKYFVALENGLLNLKTLELHEFTKHIFVKDFYEREFDEEFDEEVFRESFNYRSSEDGIGREQLEALLNYESSGLCAESRGQFMIVLVGDGDNGKDIEVMKLDLAVPHKTTRVRDPTGHFTNRSIIKDKFVVVAEARLLRGTDGDFERIKELTSSRPVEINSKYRDTFVMERYPLMICMTNRIGERVSEEMAENEAVLKRIRVIEFNKRFKPDGSFDIRVIDDEMGHNLRFQSLLRRCHRILNDEVKISGDEIKKMTSEFLDDQLEGNLRFFSEVGCESSDEGVMTYVSVDAYYRLYMRWRSKQRTARIANLGKRELGRLRDSMSENTVNWKHKTKIEQIKIPAEMQEKYNLKVKEYCFRVEIFDEEAFETLVKIRAKRDSILVYL